MQEISLVMFWLHDLKGVAKPSSMRGQAGTSTGSKGPSAQLGPSQSPSGTSRRKSELSVSFYSSDDL